MLDFVLGLIGTILYPLFSIIFVFIDGIQLVFNAFAGIGSVKFGGTPINAGVTGHETDQGLIYYLFQNSLVKNMLFSIMLLALFLVVIFTVMAFIKNAYAAKQKGWKEIIGNSIKGLANFIFIPVCCLLGVWLANILLQAINGATSNGGATEMSRKLFIAAAYNSNEFRTGDADESDWKDLQEFAKEYGYKDADQIKAGLSNLEYASFVDDIYATTNVWISNQVSVGEWYQVWSINYLVLIVGGIFMLYVLCALAFAMVRRLFLLIILFIISPGVCALYPLDEGKAVNSWKGEFVKLVLSAYGAVAGMNIFFSIMPLIDKIQIAGGGANGGNSTLSSLVQIFILIVGLLCVKEVIGLISGFVGGEDAMSKGTSLRKEATSQFKSGVKKTAKFVGVASKPVGALAKGLFNVSKGAVKSAGNAGKAIGHGLGDAARWAGDKAHTAKLHRYARKEGYGEGRGKNFKYVDSIGNGVNDEFMEDVVDTIDFNKKAARKEKWSNSKLGKGISGIGGKISDFGEKASDIAHKAGDKAAELGGKIKDSKFGHGVGTAAHWTADKAKKVGGGIKNSALGQAVAEEAKKVPSGLGAIARTVASETGASKFVDEIKGEYLGARDAWDSREKKHAAGPQGVNKAKGNLEKFLEGIEKRNAGLPEDQRVTFMSKDVIDALGDKFGDIMAKQLIAGKLTNADGSKFDASALGLDKNSTNEDLANIDKVLSKLQSYATRINNAEEGSAEREELVKAALKYATEADDGGNEKLREAINAALKEFAKNKESGTVKLDDKAIKDLAKASTDAANVMVRTMKEMPRAMAAAVAAEMRKDKK